MALLRSVAPDDVAAAQHRLLAIARQAAIAGDRAHVRMQQAGIEQLADQEAHAAGGMEVVHVGLAVGIDAAERRHYVGQIGEIVPAQADAGGARHDRQMQRVVGRAAGGQQADDAVDDRALVDHLADRA